MADPASIEAEEGSDVEELSLPPQRHILEYFNTCIEGRAMTTGMIQELKTNPNCIACKKGSQSKLDLSEQQQTFIQANLKTVFPFEGNWIDPPDNIEPSEKFHATHLEARAINNLLAAIEFKKVNFDQARRPNFIIGILGPELDGIVEALHAYHRLSTYHSIDLFQLYLKVPQSENYWKNYVDQWDTVELMWPLARIFDILREESRHILTLQKELPKNDWRDLREPNIDLREWLIVLVQTLWLGVHPFR